MKGLLPTVPAVRLTLALLAFWLGFFLTAVLTTAFSYQLTALLFLAVMYGVLAVGMVSLLLWSQARGPLSRAVVSLFVAAVVVWHVHEQTLLPHGKLQLILTALLLGLALYLFCRERAEQRAISRPGMILTLSALMFLVLVGVAYHASPMLRWHLLRHNTLVGTPAYYVFDRSFQQIRQEAIAAYPKAPQEDALPAVATGSGRQATPNIIFIMIDTLRADGLAAYGGADELMPKLNAMARESHVFLDVWSNASWTKPSIGSIMTGLLPEEHGALDYADALPEEHLTLAESLKALGFQTLAFVANPMISASTRFDQGFDHFESVRDPEYDYPRAAEINSVVRQRLEEVSPDGRMFLYVHYMDPHLPYLSGGRDSVLPSVARHAYDMELRYLDEQLAELLEYLEMFGDSSILIMSDHGEEFRDHDGDYLRHGHSLYQELIFLPVLLKTPWMEEGVLVDANLEARDFHGLLLDLAGGGRIDVADWAVQHSRAVRYSATFLSGRFPVDRPYLRNVFLRAVREGRYVLIWSAFGNTLELYDLGEDPLQTFNLASSRPTLRDEMLEALRGYEIYWYGQRAAKLSAEELERLRGLGYIH